MNLAKFPYKAKIRDANGIQTFLWLMENVGLSDYSYREGEYFFKREEDAIMFKLRWS